jgi:hypothetical protein
MDTVRRHGRNYEPEFLLRYFYLTNPLGLLGQARLGFDMWRKGKIGLNPHPIKGRDEVETIFRKSLALDMEKEGHA